MIAASVAFLAALAVTLLLTPAARRLALRVGAVDEAGSARKVHRRPVARLGGLAIVIGFHLALAAAAFAAGEVPGLLRGAGPLLAGGLAIAAIGLWDDLRGLTATPKLVLELAVAAGLAHSGLRIEAVSLPGFGELALGWTSLPVTVLWIAGVANAVNLLDGLDGLAAGVATVAAAAMALLGAAEGSPLAVVLAAGLGGAALGFLRYNYNPASIFMGDGGSLFLGYVLAAASLVSHRAAPGSTGLLVSALVLGLPIADTLLAIGRRAARGVSPFRPDREHIHHRLLDSGLGHRGAVLVLWAASVFLAASALLLALGGVGLQAAALAVLAAVVPASARRLGYGRLALPREAPVPRRGPGQPI